MLFDLSHTEETDARIKQILELSVKVPTQEITNEQIQKEIKEAYITLGKEVSERGNFDDASQCQKFIMSLDAKELTSMLMAETEDTELNNSCQSLLKELAQFKLAEKVKSFEDTIFSRMIQVIYSNSIDHKPVECQKILQDLACRTFTFVDIEDSLEKLFVETIKKKIKLRLFDKDVAFQQSLGKHYISQCGLRIQNCRVCKKKSVHSTKQKFICECKKDSQISQNKRRKLNK